MQLVLHILRIEHRFATGVGPIQSGVVQACSEASPLSSAVLAESGGASFGYSELLLVATGRHLEYASFFSPLLFGLIVLNQEAHERVIVFLKRTIGACFSLLESLEVHNFELQ